MPGIFGGLKPESLWKHFEQILKIPHCSGQEKPLGDYVISEAKRLGLSWKRDEVGNVAVSKPASAGKGGSAPLILQGHLDMVGEKNSDIVHDFAKDPIRASIKGEWVQAEGTTLGADNGIGIAACLAVMQDKELVHGPLEFLFTVDEETGLTGANKLAKGLLKGTMLLNLDSEEEGTFTIGCAGGADSVITLALKRKKAASGNLYRLLISGLRGGHSGIDIHQGRGNAIKLLARMLGQAQKEHRFGLVQMEGGNKRNAIPREAWALISVPSAAGKALSGSFKKAFEKIRSEYKTVETGVKYSFDKADGREFALAAESQKNLLNLLAGLPHGVVAMHPKIAGLVETSTNLAIIRCEKKQAQVVCSTRSSVASALQATREVLEAVCAMAGAKIAMQDGYPGWMPNLQSALLAKLLDVHRKVTGKEAEVKAIHAGLECGIIGEKYPGMDMISFGPTIEHPHSPDERVHIGSVERFWTFVTALLAALG